MPDVNNPIDMQEETHEIFINCDSPFRDILIAELDAIGYGAFVELEHGFHAYLLEKDLNKSAIEELKKRYAELFDFEYKISLVKKKNWNEDWEKSYEPIIIEDKVIVHASFHQLDRTYPFQITINPKMSFGTGHHETTYLMIKHQLTMDHKGKSVLDVGCGTGILTIMACLSGATKLAACDIDDWCIDNSKENFELNNCKKVDLRLAEVGDFQQKFEIILANINRNVLLNDLEKYHSILEDQGHLLISGFYEEDKKLIIDKTKTLNLKIISSLSRNNWACLLFKK